MLKPFIARVASFQDLKADEAEAAMEIIMTGQATPAQIGGYLMALHMKGETVDEIFGSARAMRAHASKVCLNLDGCSLLDTAGTGGDGSHSFNISTAAALVIAGAGRKVAKHGNGAATSSCGSADVLAALGVNLKLTPQQVAACIEQVGIGFMFAPAFHPAMKHAIAPRRELGQRTIFNLLGPLTNPAGATHQLMGVYDASLTETMAKVLGSLGIQAAYVVHACSGLDELTTDGQNVISHLKDGRVKTFELDAQSLGLRRARPETLRGGNPPENAAILREILSGVDDSPRRDVVLLNAGAALALESGDLRAGLAEAEESLHSGAAFAKLEALAAVFTADGAGMTFLDRILAAKHLEVQQRARVTPLAEVRSMAEVAPPASDFIAALRRPAGRASLRLIAEIKHASPSRGLLVEDFDPLRLAETYRDCGAAAISVLTDEKFFQGSLDILRGIAALPSHPPLLCKDFIDDPYQVYEARAAGADAVLLIVAALTAGQLVELSALARRLGMAALIEVHNQAELSLALACTPRLIGINNRDLHTFEVSLDTCLQLRSCIPAGILTVAESGIHTRRDVQQLAQAGFDAMLVGEKLVTAANPAAAMRELLG